MEALTRAALHEKLGELAEIIDAVEDQAYQRGYEKGEEAGIHKARVLLGQAIGQPIQEEPKVLDAVIVEEGPDGASVQRGEG